MAFSQRVQEYLDLLNRITQETFRQYQDKYTLYMNERMESRGLGPATSGIGQRALSEGLGQIAAKQSVQMLQNAALAWQLDSQERAQNEARQQGQQQSAMAAAWGDRLAIERAMGGQGEGYLGASEANRRIHQDPMGRDRGNPYWTVGAGGTLTHPGSQPPYGQRSAGGVFGGSTGPIGHELGRGTGSAGGVFPGAGGRYPQWEDK